MEQPQQKYQIEIEYDGTDFFGYQIQKDVRTIQGEIQEALFKIYQKEIALISAGRTDTGVHALAQSACFTAPENIPPENIKRALNSNLPDDIAIKKCCVRPQDFHPRFDALYKIYGYRFHTSYLKKAIGRNYSYHYRASVDLKKIREVCRLLEGTHDFKSFACLRGDEDGTEDTTRTIYQIQIIEQPEDTYELHFYGSGFLYKMVRMLMGTILHYASDKYTMIEIQNFLHNPHYGSAGPAAPGHGLTLLKVSYEPYQT